jgi:hypothetical protein
LVFRQPSDCPRLQRCVVVIELGNLSEKPIELLLVVLLSRVRSTVWSRVVALKRPGFIDSYTTAVCFRTEVSVSVGRLASDGAALEPSPEPPFVPVALDWQALRAIAASSTDTNVFNVIVTPWVVARF